MTEPRAAPRASAPGLRLPLLYRSTSLQGMNLIVKLRNTVRANNAHSVIRLPLHPVGDDQRSLPQSQGHFLICKTKERFILALQCKGSSDCVALMASPFHLFKIYSETWSHLSFTPLRGRELTEKVTEAHIWRSRGWASMIMSKDTRGHHCLHPNQSLSD